MINKKIKSLISLQRPARAEIRGTADINTKKLKQELHKSDSASRFKLIVDWGGGAEPILMTAKKWSSFNSFPRMERSRIIAKQRQPLQGGHEKIEEQGLVASA
jgi:hypothetical protein